MSITLDPNRQWVKKAWVTIPFSALTSGQAASAINMPPGAVITGGSVVVTTAFNSATSDALTVGDTTSATKYLSTDNIHTTGLTALVPTGYVSQGEDLQVTWTGVGAAPTAGSFTLGIDYYIQGEAEMTYGNFPQATQITN